MEFLPGGTHVGFHVFPQEIKHTITVSLTNILSHAQTNIKKIANKQTKFNNVKQSVTMSCSFTQVLLLKQTHTLAYTYHKQVPICENISIR